MWKEISALQELSNNTTEEVHVILFHVICEREVKVCNRMRLVALAITDSTIDDCRAENCFAAPRASVKPKERGRTLQPVLVLRTLKKPVTGMW